MKQILRIGTGRFVQLDSYWTHHETRREALVVIGLGLMIASITVGALLGADITNPNQRINHGQPKAVIK